jgi:hypothetical protein
MFCPRSPKRSSSCFAIAALRSGAGEKTGPLSQGVQARGKALRIRHINGIEVRKKRPRGFKREAQGVQVSPLSPHALSPCLVPWLR